jgi:hypothetical protein
MSEHTTKPSSVDDDIDLNEVIKAIGDFFKKIVLGILSIFKFYYKHKFILLGLIVFGAILGYFYEQNAEKTYTNDLLVTPNFESSDYLYTKIEVLENKLFQDDTIFLKDIFGKDYEDVSSIEIKPVIDIYNFVSRKDTYQDLFQLLFEEEGNIEFIEDPINSRNFKFHHIYFEVQGEDSHEILTDSLQKYLNDNVYFKQLSLLNIENLNTQLKENRSMIKQIDSLVSYAKKDKFLEIGTTGLNFSDNAGLNNLLSTKKELVKQEKDIQANLVNQETTIKVVDINYKFLNSEDFFNKNKVKLFPLLLLIVYSFIFLIRYISNISKRIIK